MELIFHAQAHAAKLKLASGIANGERNEFRTGHKISTQARIPPNRLPIWVNCITYFFSTFVVCVAKFYHKCDLFMRETDDGWMCCILFLKVNTQTQIPSASTYVFMGWSQVWLLAWVERMIYEQQAGHGGSNHKNKLAAFFSSLTSSECYCP